jgi:WD40 repeat protein
LRLETGGHAEEISRIALDTANNFLITGSKDKTIRVWDINNKTLLKTLRPPIGSGHEGKIFAVALSPDGQTIACGGYTGTTWDQTFSIYIFNRLTGKLTKKLANLPSSIGDLAFSPDGTILLAGLHGRTGWHVYRTSDFKLIAQSEFYYPTSYVYGVAFDHAGRFATSSYDGFIRLYDHDFRLITKSQPSEGKRPYGLAFSPDGTQIGVGFIDSPQVALLSGKDLSLLGSQPTIGTALTGTFSSVAWSQDGKSLYAGGTARENMNHFLRKWTLPNVHQFTDIPITQNTILDLAPFEIGGVAFSGAGGAFGLLDAEANLWFSPETASADFRDIHQGLLLSEDGSTVQFAYAQFGKHPAQFSIETRVLSFPPIDTIPLHPPLQTSQEISVGEWLNMRSPTINGKKLSLDSYEVARSVAISPDHQSVLLGTSWNLRLYDRKGRQVWQTAIPDNAWGVNISQDGQVAVAALGDGTIRWYRLKDGEELLAFFPHRDHERWVVWTPSGFYDAAPGSEQLIGWHKNYGADYSADFFPVGRFRTISYRPEIIQKMLATWDEKEAQRLAEGEKRSTDPKPDNISKSLLQEVSTRQEKLEKTVSQAAEGRQVPADGENQKLGAKVQELQQQLTEARLLAEQGGQAQRQQMIQQQAALEAELARLTLETLFKDFPPEVVIFSPQSTLVTSDPILTIHYTVITHPQAPVTDISVLIDGQPLPGTRGIRVLGNFPTGHVHQTLEVPLPQKNSTIALLAQHRWATSKPATIKVQWDETIAKPNLYVLAIGPGEYGDPSLKVPTAPTDAEIFIATLTQQTQRLYDRVETKTLINAQATKDNILDGLDWLHQQTTQKDVAMLFFAGHSVTDKGGIPYLLTTQSDLDHLRRTSLSLSDITNAVISMAGKSLLFLDPCQPNTPPGSIGCIQGVNALSQDLGNASNAVVAFLASSGSQRAIHDPSWNHSAFTTALVEGLGGQMNSSDSGIVSMNRLELYLSERIKELTQGHQRPTTIKPHTMQDFPLAMAPTSDPQRPAPHLVNVSRVTEVQPAQEILSRLPPVVTILSPSDHETVNSSNLTIRYSVRNPSGEPVTDIVALVDGRPAPKARGVKVLKGKSRKMGVKEYSLAIPKRDVTVSLIAKNRWAASEPASVRLRWNGAEPQFTTKPTLNVLAVGISAYKDSTLALEFAAKDAQDFSEALRRQAGGLYEKVNVKLITDQDATKNKILEGLENFRGLGMDRFSYLPLRFGHDFLSWSWC